MQLGSFPIEGTTVTLYEALSLVVSVLGFFLVILTVLALTRTIKVGAFSSVSQMTMDFDRVFLDYPELRPYFYEGKDLAADGDQEAGSAARILAMAQLHLDYYDLVLFQKISFPQPWDKAYWDEYIVRRFETSPVLCKYLEANQKWYSEALKELWLKSQAQPERT